MMLVFLKLRKKQTPVYAANSCFYSKNNLRQLLTVQVFPPHLGRGWQKRQDGCWGVCLKVLRQKDLEMLTKDFDEI